MILADWIALVLMLAAVALGLLFGFGKCLKFFTGGIFGIIIAVVVCYFTLGLVLDIPFVSTFLSDINDSLYSKGSVATFFADIQIGKVIIAIILFVVVQLLRIVVVRILKSIVELDNIVFKVINRALGAAFMFAILVALVLLVFHIFAWVGGNTYQNLLDSLEGSALGLYGLCENNPLISIFS